VTAFLAIAAVLAVLACAFVVVPLLRAGRSAEASQPAHWAALGAIAAIVGGGAILYATWSNWSWQPAATAGGDTAQDMVARLARRMEREPDDLAGWLMLGRSYAVLEQYPLAIRAFQRADRLAEGRNVEALVGLGEAMTLENEAELAGRAGQLFERALEIEPGSGKALFFGALSAMRRGDAPLARERFATLLSLNPPENVRPLLEQQIAAIDRQLAAGGGGPATSSPATGGTTAPAASAPSTAAAAARASGTQVRVRVVAGSQVPRDLGGAPLFVIVRDPSAPGPPLAVKRLANTLPQEVVLTPADSMMAERSFAAGQSVEVVARIARGNAPTATSGDPYGQLRYHVGRDGLRDLVIDRITP
jgi:cytochrome c-type biogenesis protein CcmH